MIGIGKAIIFILQKINSLAQTLTQNQTNNPSDRWPLAIYYKIIRLLNTKV